ncbi:DNA primase family protein [Turicibacter sanguinis]|uniref:DNA primase family protein n=1 Tax=Turicibacter sanguinis TaxID=154288 RepID=UPI0018A0E94F|nr:phage/plasmid primase, P4 family [Turicibacter sanguinis]
MTQLNQPLHEKLSIIFEVEPLSPQIILNEPLITHRINDELNNDLLDRALLSNIIPFGDDLVTDIIKSMKSEERQIYLHQLKESVDHNELQPLSYEIISSMGFNIGGDGIAFNNIISSMEQEMFSRRGLKKIKRGYDINFNIFVRYLLTRMHIYIIGSEFIAYDFKTGRYLYVMDDFIKAQAKIILHEAIDDIWKISYGKSVLEQLRMDAPRLQCVEEDKRYLNLKNGMLSLSDFKLLPHSPSIISLSQLPIEYDCNAECPYFLEYLNTVFEGDQNRIALIQEIFGYCLTADTHLQKFFIFYGNGSNGKSVLANIMSKVIGRDNCSNATLEQLSKQFGGQVIQNKRINISGESDSSRNILNTQQLKLITGEDMVQIERKFENPIMIKPYVKLIVLSNHYPKTEDTSDGFLRRCLFIPFNMRFVEPGTELNDQEAYKDKSLQSKLDSELNGIFMWALEGYKRLKNQNYTLTECEACEKVLKDFMIYNNPVKEFIVEQLKVCPGNRESKNSIYAAYQNWCKRNNVRSGLNISSKEFWNEFEKSIVVFSNYQYKQQKSNGNRYICDLKIKCA